MRKLSFISALFLVILFSSCTKDDLLDYFHKNKGNGHKLAGAIFAMTNNFDKNQIVAYQRKMDGSLEYIGAFPTGGKGVNLNPSGAPTFNDPLVSQDPLIIGYDHKFIFAVNAGSNDVSSFRIDGSRHLSLADIVSSGGQAPVSLANYKNWLYVVNAMNGGSIQGYNVKNSGKLEPISGSNKSLTNVAASNIEFSPDGKFLIVSELNNNKLTVFPIDHYGKPGNPMTQASHGAGPFGAVFTTNGIFIVTEAAGGGASGAAVSSYKLNANGALSVISGSIASGQPASCWVELTDNDKYAYTSNTPAGTISSYRVAKDGTLTLLESVAGETEPGSFVLDAEAADRYLYVVANTIEEIAVFKIENGGGLTFIEYVDNPLFEAGKFTGIAGF